MWNTKHDTYCLSDPWWNVENSLQLVMVQVTDDLDLFNKTMAVRCNTNTMHIGVTRKVVSVLYQQIKWKWLKPWMAITFSCLRSLWSCWQQLSLDATEWLKTESRRRHNWCTAFKHNLGMWWYLQLIILLHIQQNPFLPYIPACAPTIANLSQGTRFQVLVLCMLHSFLLLQSHWSRTHDVYY